MCYIDPKSFNFSHCLVDFFFFHPHIQLSTQLFPLISFKLLKGCFSKTAVVSFPPSCGIRWSFKTLFTGCVRCLQSFAIGGRAQSLTPPRMSKVHCIQYYLLFHGHEKWRFLCCPQNLRGLHSKEGTRVRRAPKAACTSSSQTVRISEEENVFLQAFKETTHASFLNANNNNAVYYYFFFFFIEI